MNGSVTEEKNSFGYCNFNFKFLPPALSPAPDQLPPDLVPIHHPSSPLSLRQRLCLHTGSRRGVTCVLSAQDPHPPPPLGKRS